MESVLGRNTLSASRGRQHSRMRKISRRQKRTNMKLTRNHEEARRKKEEAATHAVYLHKLPAHKTWYILNKKGQYMYRKKYEVE
jgi:hypothetical protein